MMREAVAGPRSVTARPYPRPSAPPPQLALPQCGAVIRCEEHGTLGGKPSSLGEGFVILPATSAGGASGAVRVSAPTSSHKGNPI